MGNFIKIMLGEGKMVRHLDTRRRLDPGRSYTVPKISYWLRRLEQGDVVLIESEKKVEKPKRNPRKSKKQSKKSESLENQNQMIGEE